MLIGLSSADSLLHGDNGWLSISVISDVIGRNLEAFATDKEEDVIMFTLDFNVGFITGAYGVDRAFMLQIEGVAVESGSGCVIEDSLIRDIDVKDRAENECGFSGSDSEGDIKGEDKAEDIGSIVNFREIDFGIIGLGMIKFVWLVMILPVLVAEFKLGRSGFLKCSFGRIKII